ncbi:Hypothetical predicted protein [Xyrichtys novacula]|uniref:Uncharacterized protein n=1 Tax=Xyrichtys novacula TaxID=13765 RepID=A0AAV1FPG8_XYRNO|nr:Hypothetical predicted protein [Xyrichtys novacula]
MNPAHSLSHSYFLMPYNSLQPATPPSTKGVQLRHSQHVFNIHYEQLKSQDSPRKAAIYRFSIVSSITVVDGPICCGQSVTVCQFV